MINAVGGGVDIVTQAMADNINEFIRPGDFVVIGLRGCKFQVSNRAEYTVGGGNGRITILASMAGDATNFIASALTVQAVNLQFYQELVPTNQSKDFELVWRPDVLSVFKQEGSFPGGNWQLILNPHNNSGSNMEKRAVESFQSKVSADFRFIVNSMDFNAHVLEGKRVEDLTYFMDLGETRAQIIRIPASTALNQQQFQVSPTTHAISIGFQSTYAGTDTKYSQARLRTGDKNELSLNRLFFSYAGRNTPSPDASPEFVVSRDYTTKQYVSYLMEKGAFFDTGSQETLEQWQQRGMLLHYNVPKDADDRSTSLTVSSSFSVAPADTNLVVFDHSRVIIRVTMRNGVVSEVREMVLS